jgi:DNA-binding MarR family transcriptional regulator
VIVVVAFVALALAILLWGRLTLDRYEHRILEALGRHEAKVDYISTWLTDLQAEIGFGGGAFVVALNNLVRAGLVGRGPSSTGPHVCWLTDRGRHVLRSMR